MNVTRRHLLRAAPAVAIPSLLGACATATTVESDFALALGDAQAVLTAVGSQVPSSISTIASRIIAAGSALDADLESHGGTVVSAVLVTLKDGMTDIEQFTSVPASVSEVAQAGIVAIEAYQASPSTTLVGKLEFAVGTALIDFLAFASPVSATPNPAPATIAGHLADARVHLARISTR